MATGRCDVVSGHLPGVVDADSKREWPQVCDAVENVGGKGVPSSEQEGEKKTRLNAHRRYSCKVMATVSHRLGVC